MPSLFSAKFVMVGLRSPAASLYSGSLVSEARRRTHPPCTLCAPICTSAEIKRRMLAGRLSTDCDAMAWHCLDCCQFPFRMHVWTGVVGKIERLMIDKVTGKVAYAVMSCGGILGIGADHHPIPWVLLRYNEKLGGYQVDITEQQLKNAPKLGQDESWGWSDRARDQDVYDYWR
jgi:hypothetical protein